MIEIRPEQPGDMVAIEALLDLTFGPGRFTKTAYRMREGTTPISELSYVAESKDGLVGSIQFSPIQVGTRPTLLLGPLVVHPDCQGQMIGFDLMTQGLDRARVIGHSAVILIGDAPYYARVGFEPLPRGRLILPGPFDAARLLGCALKEGALEGLEGWVGPVSK